MKNVCLLLLAVITCSHFSCNSAETTKDSIGDKSVSSSSADTDSNQVFTTDWKTLTTNFTTWYNYTTDNVKLSQDFIGLDINAEQIDKATFLRKLTTGNVIAFKTKIVRGQPVYQLFKLNSSDESIKATVRQIASTEEAHYKMEGAYLPEFNFTDLNGNVYNKSTTKGKLIVLKCWFIHCVACVKEFPELNKLVDENRDKNDILFVSLALDSKEDLAKFFKRKKFKYATIANMENYMVNKLAISVFPTHLLIDRTGKIRKVVNRIDDLLPFLKNELDKKPL